MERYERKIKIKRVLESIDTNNNGFEDTLALINKDNLYVSILLKQSIKDLGVYTDYEEEPETIDSNSLWNTNNNGDDDGGVNPINDGINGSYGDNIDPTSTVGDINNPVTYVCLDQNALNFEGSTAVDQSFSGWDGNPETPAVYAACTNCCQYETTGPTSGGGGNSGDSGSGPSSASGCYKLNTGFVSAQPTVDTVTDYLLPIAQDWCSGTYPSCGGTYQYIDGVDPNLKPNGCFNQSGCNGEISCPPVSTHHLLTDGECSSFGSGVCIDNPLPYYNPNTPLEGCKCGDCEPTQLFANIQITDLIEGTGDNAGKWNYIFNFYCFPN